MRFNWINDHAETTGYGTVAYGMRKGLVECGHEIADDGVKIWHGLPYPTIGNASYVYTMFETPPCPPEWSVMLSTAKHVFTGSEHSKACFDVGKVKNVHVVGHGVRQDLWKEREKNWGGFRFGCWAEHVPRKFLSILIDAFVAEFENDADVKLMLKTWCVNKNVARLFAGKRNVVFLSGNVPDLVSLYHRVDSYVLPSVEGWGLTQMEAIAAGLKPIVLGWGGVLDFCDNSNSVRVRTDPMTRVPPDPLFEFSRPYMAWHRPNVESLRASMRSVYDAGGLYLTEGESKAFAKKWTWKSVAKKLSRVIEHDMCA